MMLVLVTPLSAANRPVLLWGLLANAANTTSVVPSWWIFVDDHFSVGQQHFQDFRTSQ
jgi:hypothetical protein